ncbi:hypothetical protein Syun_005675 [Stephania yunnanensis]|uniref:Uncharacterized protein n=1 Tax=Stephania yunnanensis TaxID=152371 RepID=A0AAP0L582_9MAGN
MGPLLRCGRPPPILPLRCYSVSLEMGWKRWKTTSTLRWWMLETCMAEAHLMVYEKPEANGRYICTAYRGSILVLVNKVKTF